MRRLDLSSYTRAEDFFEAVRDAAKERADILREIGALEAREGVRAQGYEATGRSPRSFDRTAATDDRIDYEDAHSPLLEEDDDIIALAESLIWGGEGGDMSGGVARLAGYAVAKVMELRYVHDLPLASVARRMGYSPNSGGSVTRLCRTGLECVDSHRLMEVVGGDPRDATERLRDAPPSAKKHSPA